MVSIPRFAALLVISLCVISFSEARPCKTFFISSYSFSVHRHQNPHLNLPSGFVTIFTKIRQSDPSSIDSSEFFFLPHGFPSSDGRDEIELEVVDERPPLRLGHHESQLAADFPAEFSYDFTSLRDRTKDILSVVVALLFGVGCGALTAAIMYLAYSLFSNRFQDRYSLYGGYGDDDEDDGNDSADGSDLKKMGYVKIPAELTLAPAKAVV